MREIGSVVEQVRDKTLDDFMGLSNELSTTLLGRSSLKKRQREERKLLLEKRQVLLKFLGIEL